MPARNGLLQTARRVGWPRLLSWLLRPRTLLRALRWVDVLTPEGNIVPRVIYRTVRAQQLKPGRLVVVGDVHGCGDELQQLLGSCRFDPQRDNLAFVGDLCNKGPKSQQVVQQARELGALVARGNHDDAALAGWHAKRRGNSIKPKLDWVVNLKAADVAWLEELPFLVSLPDYGLLLVHAGLVPGVRLRQQDMLCMCKMRDLKQRPDGSYEALEEPVDGSLPWGTLWPGAQHVLFGHDAKRRLQQHSFCTGLDTGCVYGGALTAAVIPPLQQLRESKAFMSKLERGEPLTLSDLQAQLVEVPGKEYETPKLKSSKQ